jgi:hypothetical protein
MKKEEWLVGMVEKWTAVVVTLSTLLLSGILRQCTLASPSARRTNGSMSSE